MEGLTLSCSTCERGVVGTAPVKGARLCKFGCGEWVSNRPNFIVRFWNLLRDK